MNDGDTLSNVFEPASTLAAYTGTVVDFTKEFVFENSITVNLDQANVDLGALKGRYVYVDSTSKRNTVYRIQSAEAVDGKVVLHLGNTSLIGGFVDKFDFAKGYHYAIAKGQNIRIPMSYTK